MTEKNTEQWQKAISVLEQHAKTTIEAKGRYNYMKVVAVGYATIINDCCGGCPDKDSTYHCNDYETCIDCWLAWAVRKSQSTKE